MEIKNRTQPSPDVPPIPRKPLDNPARPKPTYGSDAEIAALLHAILPRVPQLLEVDAQSPTPLLDALMAQDRELARQLIFIAAVNHRTADERRTAEYLLRNRDAVVSGRRSAHSLLRAARCAAEMDVRRVQMREVPVPHDSLARCAARPAVRGNDPSVGELVLTTLVVTTGHGPATPRGRDWVLDAVAISLALAERHSRNRGKGPSLLAMRADVRKESRLVTQLRSELREEAAATRLARMLVGADGTPIETALLWWSTRRIAAVTDVPAEIRRRWLRDLRAVDAAAARLDGRPRPGRRCAPVGRQTAAHAHRPFG